MERATDDEQRRGSKRRVVLIAAISVLVLIACLVSQAGAISDALGRSASPSRAMLVALDVSSADHTTFSALSGRDGSARWRRQLDLAYMSGLVTDGVVYVAGLMHGKPTEPTVVEALRLSDGATLWRMTYPETPSTILHMLVANGLLILTTTVDIAAVSLSTHALTWRNSLSNFSWRWGAHALATAAGMLYVSSTDGSVSAYRLSDGRRIWTTPITGNEANGQWVWLVARDDTLLAYDNQEAIISLRPADGSALWKRTLSLAPTADAQTTATSADIIMCSAGSPSAPSQPVIIDPATGVTLWSHQSTCMGPTPIVSGAYVYMLMYGLLTVVRVSDGSVVWRAGPAESDLAYSNLYSDGDVLFASTTALKYSPVSTFCARVWIASVGLCPSQTYLAAFDGATGKRYWRSADGYDVFLGVAHP